jgi:MFS family permease
LEDADTMSVHPAPVSPFRQPRAVYAVAFACVVSFMGIDLVDPILPALAEQLDASRAQVSLLFTSYLVVTAVAMLVTGWVSSRIGAKRTLILGLSLIVAFSLAAASSDTIGQIVGFRAGWGLGTRCSSRPRWPSSWPRPAAGSPARLCCTRPRSGSASPPARSSAGCWAASPGGVRSSASRC